MVVRRGEIWWASLATPQGPGPGYRRPILIVQSNEFNRSRIDTVIAAVITSNLILADAPGNIRIPARVSGLKKESVVNVSQIITVSKSYLTERVGEALHPEGHPYSWSVIGYLEDLDRVDVNDLKKFFLRWYGPNNATLTMGGDIDPEQALAWVARYYGSIPRGPEVEMPLKPVVTLDKDRYISMEDRVSLPLLYMSQSSPISHS